MSLAAISVFSSNSTSFKYSFWSPTLRRALSIFKLWSFYSILSAGCTDLFSWLLSFVSSIIPIYQLSFLTVHSFFLKWNSNSINQPLFCWQCKAEIRLIRCLLISFFYSNYSTLFMWKEYFWTILYRLIFFFFFFTINHFIFISYFVSKLTLLICW
jgi:hypothetical protein